MDIQRKILPPVSKLNGQQLAGEWIPKKTSSRNASGMFLIADLAVPLPDGTILRGDLYLPGKEGSFPLLLAWGTYTRTFQQSGIPLPINEAGDARYFSERGYAHLTVNARGTGKSDGEHTIHFSPEEQKDVADVVEWCASQPWCDGNVGMIGRSYFAAIQYFTASQRPPHLKTIFVYSGFTDLYRHFSHRGGAFSNGFFSPYYTFVGTTQNVSIPPLFRHLLSYIFNRRSLQDRIERYFYTHEDDMPQRLHPSASWMQQLRELTFEQLYDGPFYQVRSATLELLARIQIPAWIGSNWGDMLHLRGALTAWASLSGPKKLVIGPPDPRWPWTQYHEEALAWYDCHLKGIDTGIMEQPTVRYWLMGAERWEQADIWPLPDVKKHRFYLAGEATDALTLQLQTEQKQTHASFHAVPPGMKHPRELEKHLTQYLTYTTEPFNEATKIVGPVQLSLKLSSTAPDTHVFVRMSDVDPAGNRRILSLGWLQVSHRAIDEERSRPDEIIHKHTRSSLQFLTSDEPISMTLSLSPTANLFHKGHCLSLEIGSRSDLLRATFFDGFVFHPYDAPLYAARNTIYHSDCSYLEVDIPLK
jgi:uncharacterized protein